MQQYKLMKSILAAKVILIVSALALHQGWIRIGDLPVVAANESVKEKDGKEDGKEDGEKKGEPKPAEERATSPQDAVKMKDENEAKKEDATRKSFLSDLFTLRCCFFFFCLSFFFFNDTATTEIYT